MSLAFATLTLVNIIEENATQKKSRRFSVISVSLIAVDSAESEVDTSGLNQYSRQKLLQLKEM